MEQPNPNYRVKIGADLYEYRDKDSCWYSPSGDLSFSYSQVERLLQQGVATQDAGPFETKMKINFDHNGHAIGTLRHQDLPNLVRGIVGKNHADRQAVAKKSYEVIVRELRHENISTIGKLN